MGFLGSIPDQNWFKTEIIYWNLANTDKTWILKILNKTCQNSDEKTDKYDENLTI